MKKLLVALVSLLLVGGIGCSEVVPYKDSTFDVAALNTTTVNITMPKGGLLEGYLTVRGGNDDIRFYAKDSYGNKVLDIGVKGRYDFSYTATSEGFHTLYFDNSFSLLTKKQVLIHYRVR